MTELTVYGSAISYYTGKLADELLSGIPLPGFVKRFVMKQRQGGFYLCANAEAFAAGRSRHDATIQGVRYRNLPVSQYRVWCLERLRAHFEALPDETRAQARALLEQHGCWEPLWRTPNLESRHDPDDQVPFRGRKVHYDLQKPSHQSIDGERK